MDDATECVRTRFGPNLSAIIEPRGSMQPLSFNFTKMSGTITPDGPKQCTPLSDKAAYKLSLSIIDLIEPDDDVLADPKDPNWNGKGHALNDMELLD
jgi:hypothetical protein